MERGGCVDRWLSGGRSKTCHRGPRGVAQRPKNMFVRCVAKKNAHSIHPTRARHPSDNPPTIPRHLVRQPPDKCTSVREGGGHCQRGRGNHCQGPPGGGARIVRPTLLATPNLPSRGLVDRHAKTCFVPWSEYDAFPPASTSFHPPLSTHSTSTQE